MYSLGIQEQMEKESNKVREGVKKYEIEATKSGTEVEATLNQNEVEKVDEEVNKPADRQEHEDKDDYEEDSDDDNKEEKDYANDDNNEDEDDDYEHIGRDNVGGNNAKDKDNDNIEDGEVHKAEHISEELREVDANATPESKSVEVEEAKKQQQLHRGEISSNIEMEEKEERV